MNKIYGLLGGFFIMGSVGGLEQGTMSMLHALSFSLIGFSLVFYVLIKKELI